jgi:hypothetical protein
MAKKKKEEVVEQATEQLKVDDTVEKIKVKKKPSVKKFSNDSDSVTKVDLSKPPKTETDAVQERKTEKVDVGEQTGDGEEVGGGGTEPSSKEDQPIQDEPKIEDTPVIEEITGEEETVEELEEQVVEAIVESQETGKELPENIQKLMDFMEDTGGDINDYVRLNQDYSKLDDNSLLREYYKESKPHLNNEEINFLMEDNFSYDEDIDDERDIKRKKLALKEQVASAKAHLDRQKSKYYEDIKAGSKLTQEQQKAIDFFNRYNKESEETNKLVKEQSDNFLSETNQVFNDRFKGFEYNIGDKKFRFNVNNANEVKENQSDINNFVQKFLDKNNKWENAKGYHKSLYTAMNADAVANHFYEQGRADAMKNSIAKSKNVDMEPRQSHGQIEAGGMKFKVLGEDSTDFKFKIKQK